MEGWGLAAESKGVVHDDSGGASRFFYCAKAGRGERNAGLAAEREISPAEVTGRKPDSADLVMAGGKANPFAGPSGAARRNPHPTVKPINLMRWLVRLVTPPGGVVLDPFMGSGTTACACEVEGVRWLGCEQSAEYAEIARARAAWWRKHPDGAAPPEVRDAPGQQSLFGDNQ